jgi:hypothetical protein
VVGDKDGYRRGYDLGYDDGFSLATGTGTSGSYYLSVAPTPRLRGFANVLSLAHNDLIDYRRIAPPRVTARGGANGRVLLSEVSLTNKDTLKRAPVVEQYLVLEMARQVEGKFGLSAERSLKVAKAANHFRKQASRRALTAEDTNAYAKELIGSDFTRLTGAYERALRGNPGTFADVLERAAEKNETTPENISRVLGTYFF